MSNFIAATVFSSTSSICIALDGITGQSDLDVSYVQSNNRYYRWFAANTDAASGEQVVIPNGQNPATPGRWFVQGPPGQNALIPNFPAKVQDCSNVEPSVGTANQISRVNSAGTAYTTGPATLEDSGTLSTERLRLRGSTENNGSITIVKRTTDSPGAAAFRWLVEGNGGLFIQVPTTFDDAIGTVNEYRFGAAPPAGGSATTRFFFQLRDGHPTRLCVQSTAIIGGQLVPAGASTTRTNFAGSDQESAISANTRSGPATYRGGDFAWLGGAFAATGGPAQLTGGSVLGAGDGAGSAVGGIAWTAGGRATAAAGTNIQGNVVIGGSTDALTFNYQSMQDGIHIQQATAPPASDPASGFFYWADPGDNLPRWRAPNASLPLLDGASGGNVLAEQIRDALVAYGLARV